MQCIILSTYSRLQRYFNYNNFFAECLTISSDEEEEGKARKLEGANNSNLSHDANNSFSEEMETILEKEPIITNNSVSSTCSEYIMESDDMKGILYR